MKPWEAFWKGNTGIRPQLRQILRVGRKGPGGWNQGWEAKLSPAVTLRACGRIASLGTSDEGRIQTTVKFKTAGFREGSLKGGWRGQGRTELIRVSGLRPREIRTEPALNTSIQLTTC